MNSHTPRIILNQIFSKGVFFLQELLILLKNYTHNHSKVWTFDKGLKVEERGLKKYQNILFQIV